MAAPQTIANELQDRVLSFDPERPDAEWELRLLTAETDKLANKDAFSSYVLKGIIASYKSNLEEVESEFSKAIRLDSSDYTVFANYGLSLLRCKDTIQAEQQFNKALNLLKGFYTKDLKEEYNRTFTVFADAALSNMSFRSIKTMVDESVHTGIELDDYPRVEHLIQFLEKNGISDKDFTQAADAFREVLPNYFDQKIKSGFSYQILQTESEEHALICNHIEASAEKIAEANIKLCDALANKSIPSLINDNVTLMIRQAHTS